MVVEATALKHDGDTARLLFGPFLPHAGSATTSFVEQVEGELAESGRYVSWETDVRSVFIGAGESDCAVQATR